MGSFVNKRKANIYWKIVWEVLNIPNYKVFKEESIELAWNECHDVRVERRS